MHQPRLGRDTPPVLQFPSIASFIMTRFRGPAAKALNFFVLRFKCDVALVSNVNTIFRKKLQIRRGADLIFSNKFNL